MDRPLFWDTTGVHAQVIADSLSPDGVRLTTLEVQCHRFVLAEFNTHRVFSRNSASSRAIPVRRQLTQVIESPALPLAFPAERKGMQGGADLTGKTQVAAQQEWIRARDAAVSSAERLRELGVHKSVTNRLLEPFMWHRIIVSSTDWAGFFAQRISPNAQPEIMAVATRMRDALTGSTPDELAPGTWHTPYIDPDTDAEIGTLAASDDERWTLRRQISVARCARVSYLTHAGKRDLEADLDLYRRLTTAEPPHWSPLEHVATPGAHPVTTSNFRGWTQLRQIEELSRAGS